MKVLKYSAVLQRFKKGFEIFHGFVRFLEILRDIVKGLKYSAFCEGFEIFHTFVKVLKDSGFLERFRNIPRFCEGFDLNIPPRV